MPEQQLPAIGRMMVLRAMRDTDVHDGDTDASMTEVGIVVRELKGVGLAVAERIAELTETSNQAAFVAFLGAFELGVRCGQLAAGLAPLERVCPRCQVGWRTFEPPSRCSFCNRPTLAGRLTGASRSL